VYGTLSAIPRHSKISVKTTLKIQLNKKNIDVINRFWYSIVRLRAWLSTCLSQDSGFLYYLLLLLFGFVRLLTLRPLLAYWASLGR
jgi:hypothetical protein